MLTVTGPTAFRVAEAHRRVRDNLAALRARTTGLTAISPERLERSRTAVLELLEKAVLPLADVEDELADIMSLPSALQRVPSMVARTEHDAVRELSVALRETSPVQRDDRDRTAGALRAIGDLLPAHIEGEELELLSQLDTLGQRQLERLAAVVGGLPSPIRRPQPLARVHLPTAHTAAIEMLIDPDRGSPLLPAEMAASVPQQGTRSRAAPRRRIGPVAVVVGPDAVALRFAFDEEHEHGATTLACIDGWLAPTNQGRSSVLELRATPPPYRTEGLTVTVGEVEQAAGLLGNRLARHLSRDVHGASRAAGDRVAIGSHRFETATARRRRPTRSLS